MFLIELNSFVHMCLLTLASYNHYYSLEVLHFKTIEL